MLDFLRPKASRSCKGMGLLSPPMRLSDKSRPTPCPQCCHAKGGPAFTYKVHLCACEFEVKMNLLPPDNRGWARHAVLHFIALCEFSWKTPSKDEGLMWLHQGHTKPATKPLSFCGICLGLRNPAAFLLPRAAVERESCTIVTVVPLSCNRVGAKLWTTPVLILSTISALVMTSTSMSCSKVRPTSSCTVRLRRRVLFSDSRLATCRRRDRRSSAILCMAVR